MSHRLSTTASSLQEMGGPGLRFLLEAAFLIALAVAAGLAELSATTIVLVMAAAWLLVAAIEWLAWRESPVFTRRVVEEPAPPQAAEPRRRFLRRRRRGPAEPVEAAEPEQAAEPGEDTQDFEPADEPEPVPADERART
jgi:hypothetical protein